MKTRTRKKHSARRQKAHHKPAKRRTQVPKKPATPKPRKGSSHTSRRSLDALADMREGKSLAAACRAHGLKPETFKRQVGRAIRRKTPGGRFYAASTDSLRREMLVQTEAGREPIVVRGLKQARLISAHANAIARFNRDGKVEGLRPFEGKTIRSGGRVVTLLTDPARIRELGEADALKLDSLYDGD